MSEEADVYHDHVLPHFDHPRCHGGVIDPTHQARLDNPACGDSVEIQLRVSGGGIVEEARFHASGCVISQASASMITEFAHGRSLDELREFAAGEMLALFRAPLTAHRRQCCLLAWQALQAAVGKPCVELSMVNASVPATGKA